MLLFYQKIFLMNIIFSFFSHIWGLIQENKTTGRYVWFWMKIYYQQWIWLIQQFCHFFWWLRFKSAVFASRNRIRNAVLNPRSMAINSDLINQYDISRKRDIRFAITSILLNLIFLLLNAPQSIFFFISKYFIVKSRYSNFYVQSFLILSYLNHASVFFINLAVNTQFQQEILSFCSESMKKFKNWFLK